MRWPDLTPSRPGLAGPVRRSAPAPALQPRVRGTVGPLEPCGAGPGVPALRRRPVQDAPGEPAAWSRRWVPLRRPRSRRSSGTGWPGPRAPRRPPCSRDGPGSRKPSNQSSGRPGPRGRRQGLRPTAPARCKGRSREVGRPVPGAPVLSALRRPPRARDKAGEKAGLVPGALGFPPYGARSVQEAKPGRWPVPGRRGFRPTAPAPCKGRSGQMRALGPGPGLLVPGFRLAGAMRPISARDRAPLQAVIPPARIRRQEPLRWA